MGDAADLGALVDPVVVDARDPGEDKGGAAIAGSVNVPFNVDCQKQSERPTTEEEYRSKLEAAGCLPEDRTAAIITHCGSGGRGGKATTVIQGLGYTNVHNGGSPDNIRAAGIGKKSLAKPTFIKVEKIMPEEKGINVMVKCVKAPEAVAGSDSLKETICGDDTGTVIVSVRTEEYAAICTVGASIRVQNATVRMVKGHIRLVADKWAAFKPASEPLDFTVKEDNDVSATEYELQDDGA